MWSPTEKPKEPQLVSSWRSDSLKQNRRGGPCRCCGPSRATITPLSLPRETLGGHWLVKLMEDGLWLGSYHGRRPASNLRVQVYTLASPSIPDGSRSKQTMGHCQGPAGPPASYSCPGCCSSQCTHDFSTPSCSSCFASAEWHCVDDGVRLP